MLNFVAWVDQLFVMDDAEISTNPKAKMDLESRKKCVSIHRLDSIKTGALPPKSSV